ncbi:MFS transporter [Streptomyces sp. PKU-MA01144]|uniref:MFS transporter n=1 Tax=Streptomyces sp. PKU-MA01144 TaxID=2729138 RepID=UPI00147E4726|nr:MFS transporter [Streptomyces sp. PKU-MA01144]NNJ02730.1 MFS transporter [Streptomyces sp. PKU-MA01144]
MLVTPPCPPPSPEPSPDPNSSLAPASSPAPLDPGVRRLERTLYLYAALEDFVLLYPLYALLFAEHGLDTAEISSLFALWSLTALLVEVPSGVWADIVSRRLMTAVGPLLTAAGFALWVLFPSYGAYAAGFALWGVGGGLRSGAMEALVHDELERLGAASRYARVMGRAAAVSMASTAAATAVAAPAFARGGELLVGAASVTACLLCAAVGAALPEHRVPAAPRAKSAKSVKTVKTVKSAESLKSADSAQSANSAKPAKSAKSVKSVKRRAVRGTYAATLRAGLAEVRGSSRVRHALLLSVVAGSVWGALDEYVPLLAAATGAATATVPLLVLVVWVGVTLGSLLAGPGERLSGRALGAAVAAGAAALAVGALSGGPGGFVLVGAGFLVFQLTDVLADARLQGAITGPSRATVTSLAGLGTGLTTLLVYGSYAGLSAHASHGTVFALLGLPYLAVAVALGRART